MSDDYEVLVGANAVRSIRRLPKQAQKAVVAALSSLGTDPCAGKRLTGELAGTWSLRRGDYRVLYRIDDGRRTVEVARVGHRRDVYRRAAGS